MRTCGECTLCCELLPVKELGKGAGTRCSHQSFKGCRIYASRPRSCRLWSCGWLTGGDCADLRRPDRSHYVVDPMPDFITIEDGDTGEQTKLPVIQIWCDPKYPNAHRDPALRKLLEEHSHPALVRYSERNAIVLIPPVFNKDGGWREVESGMAEKQHSAEEIAKFMEENQSV